jgi:hypothetical protein
MCKHQLIRGDYAIKKSTWSRLDPDEIHRILHNPQKAQLKENWIRQPLLMNFCKVCKKQKSCRMREPNVEKNNIYKNCRWRIDIAKKYG